MYHRCVPQTQQHHVEYVIECFLLNVMSEKTISLPPVAVLFIVGVKKRKIDRFDHCVNKG